MGNYITYQRIAFMVFSNYSNSSKGGSFFYFMYASLSMVVENNGKYNTLLLANIVKLYPLLVCVAEVARKSFVVILFKNIMAT